MMQEFDSAIFSLSLRELWHIVSLRQPTNAISKKGKNSVEMSNKSSFIPSAIIVFFFFQDISASLHVIAELNSNFYYLFWRVECD